MNVIKAGELTLSVQVFTNLQNTFSLELLYAVYTVISQGFLSFYSTGGASWTWGSPVRTSGCCWCRGHRDTGQRRWRGTQSFCCQGQRREGYGRRTEEVCERFAKFDRFWLTKVTNPLSLSLSDWGVRWTIYVPILI